MSQAIFEKFAEYIINGGQPIGKNVESKYIEEIIQKLNEQGIIYFYEENPSNGTFTVQVRKEDQNAFLDIQKEVFHYPYSIERLKSNIITLYHGSDHVVGKPIYGKGGKDNDYGSGFYLTPDPTQAELWACSTGDKNGAIRNDYTIDLQGLNVIDLDNYGTLAWIAEILSNRGPRNKDYLMESEMLIDMYKADLSEADIIKGYRADSIYMEIIDSFLEGELTVTEVDTLFHEGKLGIQYCLISPEAFEKIEVLPPFECKKNQENVEEKSAKQKVIKFLNQRKEDIRISRFKPNGLTIDDVTLTQFTFNLSTGFYEIKEKEETKQEDFDDYDEGV